MSAVVNDRDVLLQAATSRISTSSVGVLLQTDSLSFRVKSDNTRTPATITFKALKLAPSGTVTWSISNGALSGTGDTRTLDTSTVTADLTTVKVTLTYGGAPYEAVVTISKVQDGVPGARGPGHFYATGSSWSDTVAQAACPNSTPVPNDVVTISDNSTYTLEKMYTGTAWVAQGMVYDGNLFVTGSIGATKLSVSQLSAISATIGTLRTATTGGRVEIRDNVIAVFDTGNGLRIKMGDLNKALT